MQQKLGSVKNVNESGKGFQVHFISNNFKNITAVVKQSDAMMTQHNICEKMLVGLY
jgi:hypothetical protein